MLWIVSGLVGRVHVNGFERKGSKFIDLLKKSFREKDDVRTRSA